MSRKIKEQMIEYLKKTYEPEGIILFGDYARGTEKKSSEFRHY